MDRHWRIDGEGTACTCSALFVYFIQIDFSVNNKIHT